MDSLSFTARIRLRRKAKETALSDARDIVPERLRERFDEIAGLRYWFGASMLVSSHLRIPLLEALWPALKPHERPEVFASWFNRDDVPDYCHAFVLQALGEFKRSAQRVFDGEAARAGFARLADVVTIYRAASVKEAAEKRFGICWTLSRDKAIVMATRILNSGSQPALITARVNRSAIAGLLMERAEDEVLIMPGDLNLEQVEAFPGKDALPGSTEPRVVIAASVAAPVTSVLEAMLEATMPLVAVPYRS